MKDCNNSIDTAVLEHHLGRLMETVKNIEMKSLSNVLVLSSLCSDHASLLVEITSPSTVHGFPKA